MSLMPSEWIWALPGPGTFEQPLKLKLKPDFGVNVKVALVMTRCTA